MIWDGKHPDRPFVLFAQQSLFDPSRAPAGKHTAWGYCHVPHGSTVDMTVASLGPSWKAQFFSTFTTTDSRCQSVDHTWGIAVLARSSVLDNPQSFTLGVETSGEVRTTPVNPLSLGGQRDLVSHADELQRAAPEEFPQTEARRLLTELERGRHAGGELARDVADPQRWSRLPGLDLGVAGCGMVDGHCCAPFMWWLMECPYAATTAA